MTNEEITEGLISAAIQERMDSGRANTILAVESFKDAINRGLIIIFADGAEIQVTIGPVTTMGRGKRQPKR